MTLIRTFNFLVKRKTRLLHIFRSGLLHIVSSYYRYLGLDISSFELSKNYFSIDTLFILFVFVVSEKVSDVPKVTIIHKRQKKMCLAKVSFLHVVHLSFSYRSL